MNLEAEIYAIAFELTVEKVLRIYVASVSIEIFLGWGIKPSPYFLLVKDEFVRFKL